MTLKLCSSMVACAASTLVVAGANAAEILVNNDITVSTTWTANNVYNLQKQIYVKPGATLTIEPGTIIASTTNIGGSLAVTRGAKIIAAGTQQNPIIWTSKADVATWTGGDPKTGTWRAAANEWGNLTIMGKAYVSENAVATNTATPNANNIAPMEGLVAAGVGDPNVVYGGGNDDDDSGVIRFCSFRYGGKVVGLNNELNGLSLGGIGRETDISYVEVMNNVDDGIEVWGGTVNFKYVSIWNVGDDSFDVDQGWRGKAQFGLIVQGYSVNAAQGSGVGDNAIEMDGAEQSDYQPVTTGRRCTTSPSSASRSAVTTRPRGATTAAMQLPQLHLHGHSANASSASTTSTATVALATASTARSELGEHLDDERTTSTSAVNAPANPSAFYKCPDLGQARSRSRTASSTATSSPTPTPTRTRSA
jgi:hypothetical protein